MWLEHISIRRHVSVALCLLTSALLPGLLSAGTKDPGTKEHYRRFKSEHGGYDLRVSNQWHVKEEVGDRTYRAAIAEEELTDPDDQFRFGLRVVRLRDFTEAFQFKSSDPVKIPTEFVLQMAAKQPKCEMIYYQRELPLQGTWVTAYELLSRQPAESCLNSFIVVATWQKEWFDAIWQAPSSEWAGVQHQIFEMARSLHISRSWR